MSCKSVIHDAVPIVARFSNHDFLPNASLDVNCLAHVPKGCFFSGQSMPLSLTCSALP